MPFKTHRLIPTRENEIEVFLEIPLRQYPVTTTAPGLHSPLETISEDLRNSGIVQISNNLKEVEKEVKHYSTKAKKYKRARDVTQYIT